MLITSAAVPSYSQNVSRPAANTPTALVEPPPDGYNPSNPDAVKAMAPFSTGFIGLSAGLVAGLADGVAGGVAGAIALGAAGASASYLMGTFGEFSGEKVNYGKRALIGGLVGAAAGAAIGATTSNPVVAGVMALAGAAGAAFGTHVALQ